MCECVALWHNTWCPCKAAVGSEEHQQDHIDSDQRQNPRELQNTRRVEAIWKQSVRTQHFSISKEERLTVGLGLTNTNTFETEFQFLNIYEQEKRLYCILT